MTVLYFFISLTKQIYESSPKGLLNFSCERGHEKLPPTLGLCAGVALEFRPPEQMPGFLIKINV